MKRQDESKKEGAWMRIGRHGLSMWTLVGLLVVGLSGELSVVYAEVATAADTAACNREARERLQSDRASPTSKDEAGADAARKAHNETAKLPETSGHVTHSPDPQIHGMDGEGAKDAVYRAAYRVCMRRQGF